MILKAVSSKKKTFPRPWGAREDGEGELESKVRRTGFKEKEELSSSHGGRRRRRRQRSRKRRDAARQSRRAFFHVYEIKGEGGRRTRMFLRSWGEEKRRREKWKRKRNINDRRKEEEGLLLPLPSPFPPQGTALPTLLQVVEKNTVWT